MVNSPALKIGVLFRRCDNYADPFLPQNTRQTTGQLRKERMEQIRNHQANQISTPGLKSTCRQIRAITKPLNSAAHTLNRAGMDFLRHIDRAGYSSNRYSRTFGNFLNTHRRLLAGGPMYLPAVAARVRRHIKTYRLAVYRRDSNQAGACCSI